MGKVKQINIKNWTYYFYNNQINLKDFDARLLKADKKDYNEIDIYYTGHMTFKKIANCNSVNTLYLMIHEMISHFDEKNEHMYLLLDDVDENKKVSKNMKKFGTELKKILKRLMVGKELNMREISKKLSLSLMMTCQWINL